MLRRIKFTCEQKIDKRLISIVLFLLCVGINIHFRLFPVYFPQLKQKAKKIAETRIWLQAKSKVEQLYSNYHFYAKEEIIKELVKEYNKKDRQQKILQGYQDLKSRYQDNNGQTYLLELDSYQWKYYVENILKFGYPGQRKIGNHVYDTYVLPPLGAKVVYAQFPFYLAAFLYKIFTFFFKGFPLAKFLFYLPIFYVLVFLTILYLFSKYVFSDLAAFFTVLFVGLNRLFLQRSCAGWFDYEILALSFSLVIVWCLVFALKRRENIKRLIIYSMLASLFLGLFAYTWVGWWFIFVIVGMFLFLSLINTYLIDPKAKEGILSYLISGIVFLGGSILFCALIPHINLIKTISVHIKNTLNLGTVFSTSIWPNTYYTVAELRKVGPETIVKNLYGLVPFNFSLIGMFWLYIKEKRSQKKDFLYIIFLWTIFMTFASLRGVRFIVYLSIPLGICLGGFIEEIKELIKRRLEANSGGRTLALVFFLIFILWMGSIFVGSGLGAAQSVYPIMNDDWDKALTYIHENTPQNSIINSWWDYGSIFKERAKRRVIFDGQSQQRPLAFWMARVLLSSDEEKALRILRMVNNASDRTFDLLNEEIADPFRCIVVLERLLNSKKEDVEGILHREKIPSHLIHKILDDLYRNPPPAYFIVEDSMVSKMSHISFLANWDFRKLFVRRNIHKGKGEILKNLSEIFELPHDISTTLYRDAVLTAQGVGLNEGLSQRRKFYSSLVKGNRQDNIVYFDHGLIYDLNTEKMFLFHPEGGYKIPISAFIFKDGNFTEINFKDSSISISVMVIVEDGEYSSILLDRELATSLFSRLYFMKGKGLKYFEPFYSDDKARIYVYRIKWEEFYGSQ
jgi:dolichyl-diphosphooligosaccharide--protein glycosyltransferase